MWPSAARAVARRRNDEGQEGHRRLPLHQPDNQADSGRRQNLSSTVSLSIPAPPTIQVVHCRRRGHARLAIRAGRCRLRACQVVPAVRCPLRACQVVPAVRCLLSAYQAALVVPYRRAVATDRPGQPRKDGMRSSCGLQPDREPAPFCRRGPRGTGMKQRPMSRPMARRRDV